MARRLLAAAIVSATVSGLIALAARRREKPPAANTHPAVAAAEAPALAGIAQPSVEPMAALSTDAGRGRPVDAGVIRIPTYPRAVPVGGVTGGAGSEVRRCQALGPAAPYPIDGVDSLGPTHRPGGEPHWDARAPIPWQIFAQGEYIGPARTEHVPVYRLRVDDQLECVYRLTRDERAKPYKLEVGDVIRVESLADSELDRDLIVQPDGTITLRLLGQIHAARHTVDELRDELERRYKQFYRLPSITVTPLKANTKLEDLRAAVDNRSGFVGGQSVQVRVTPEGTIQLPAVGSIPAQGLTLDELKGEIDERYARKIQGIEITPILTERAPRFVYVVGEVRTPGRFDLTGPTTAMQAVAMAGGWNNGGNIREIVVFRRGDDWRLMATKLDLGGALLGTRPSPADEIWLRDSDIVLVPKSPLLLADDFIDLVFTRGIYGVMPFQGVSLNFNKLSTL